MPLVAGIDRNVGEMSEPFHMNDIGKERKKRKGRKKEEFFYRPHNHNHNHKYRVRHWCRWMNWVIRQGSGWLQGPQGNNTIYSIGMDGQWPWLESYKQWR